MEPRVVVYFFASIMFALSRLMMPTDTTDAPLRVVRKPLVSHHGDE